MSIFLWHFTFFSSYLIFPNFFYFSRLFYKQFLYSHFLQTLALSIIIFYDLTKILPFSFSFKLRYYLRHQNLQIHLYLHKILIDIIAFSTLAYSYLYVLRLNLVKIFKHFMIFKLFLNFLPHQVQIYGFLRYWVIFRFLFSFLLKSFWNLLISKIYLENFSFHFLLTIIVFI